MIEINIERMQQALSEDSITIPARLTFEEMREFIISNAEPLTHCMAEHDTEYCHDSRCPKIARYDDGGCPYAK